MPRRIVARCSWRWATTTSGIAGPSQPALRELLPAVVQAAGEAAHGWPRLPHLRPGSDVLPAAAGGRRAHGGDARAADSDLPGTRSGPAAPPDPLALGRPAAPSCLRAGRARPSWSRSEHDRGRPVRRPGLWSDQHEWGGAGAPGPRPRSSDGPAVPQAARRSDLAHAGGSVCRGLRRTRQCPHGAPRAYRQGTARRSPGPLPGQYVDKLLRTLQRRVRARRAAAILTFDTVWVAADPLAGAIVPLPMPGLAAAQSSG
jgi:hypothetical protein